MWKSYVNAGTVKQVLELLAEYKQDARIISGGTDLLVDIGRGKTSPEMLIDISRVGELQNIRLDSGVFRIGAGVTHNQIAGSREVADRGFPLASACWQVGAPQIRNRATVAGNVITASPANDTITPLTALHAQLTAQSLARGKRNIPVGEFIRGVRKTVLEPDELVTEISFPALKENEFGTYVKLGLRSDLAISVVNASVVIALASASRQSRIESVSITLGAVAPTIIHAIEAEAFLAYKTLEDEIISEAAALAGLCAKPIDDIRATVGYRRDMAEVLVSRALSSLQSGTERDNFPAKRIMLRGGESGKTEPRTFTNSLPDVIETTINGKPYKVKGAIDKTLLRMLREDMGLMGTKEGCCEGECGACTVFLDGAAVNACLVPAPRAHNATIVTIEGLCSDGKLHPLQTAFMETGAVQCGYCSPGFIMSGAMLLEESKNPSRDEIRRGLAGNLCRCSGYYRIIEAVEMAARLKEGDSSL